MDSNKRGKTNPTTSASAGPGTQTKNNSYSYSSSFYVSNTGIRTEYKKFHVGKFKRVLCHCNKTTFVAAEGTSTVYCSVECMLAEQTGYLFEPLQNQMGQRILMAATSPNSDGAVLTAARTVPFGRVNSFQLMDVVPSMPGSPDPNEKDNTGKNPTVQTQPSFQVTPPPPQAQAPTPGNMTPQNLAPGQNNQTHNQRPCNSSQSSGQGSTQGTQGIQPGPINQQTIPKMVPSSTNFSQSIGVEWVD